MADQLETTALDGAPQAPPSPVPASAPAPDVEARVKSAVEEARRAAQAAKDRELARVHQQYQAQLNAQKQAATTRLREVGDDDADGWAKQVEIHQKAQQYDAIQSEAQQWAAWNAHVASVAEAHGLDPADKRLANVASAAELTEKARAAMASDAAAERARLKAEASEKERQAVDRAVEAGDLDQLAGGPALPANQQASLEKQYREKVARIRGNTLAIQQLKREFRAKGLKV